MVKLPSPKPKHSNEYGVKRLSAEVVVYMELEGAVKDADCEIVEVKNGVSSELGCCDVVDPVKGANKFSCGQCTYVHKEKV